MSKRKTGHDRPDHEKLEEPDAVPVEPNPEAGGDGGAEVLADDGSIDTGDDYEVGYGKPPKEHQFPPKTSGNPRGKPKGRKNTKTLLRDALFEKVEVRDGGKTKRFSKFKVLIVAQINKAMKGDTRAFTVVMAHAERHGLNDEVEAAMEDIGTNDTAIIKAFLDRQKKKKGSDDDGETS